MRRALVLALVLGSFSGRLAQPVVGQKAPDSLRQVLARTTLDTTRVRLLLELGRAELAANPKQALDYTRQALALARQRRLQPAEVKSLLSLGRALYMLGRLPEAVQYGQQARELSQRLGLTAQLGQSYQMLGVLYAEQGHLAASKTAFRRALAQLRRAADYLGVLQAYNNLAYDYQQEGNYAEALSVYLDGLDLAKRHATTAPLASMHIALLVNMSSLYGTLSEAQPSLACLLDARQVVRRFPSASDEYGILVNLGVYYCNQKNWPQAEHYLAQALAVEKQLAEQAPTRLAALLHLHLARTAEQQNHLVQAERYLRQCEPIVRRAAQTDMDVALLLTKADLLRKQGHYAAARTAAQNSLAKLDQAQFPHTSLLAYQTLAEVSAAAADWAAAYRYQTRFQGLNDSLFSQTKAQQLATVASRYRSQQQQAQIHLLRRNTALQQRTRYLLVGILAVVVLMGGATYHRYQRERRFRRRLQAQELELAARNQALLSSEQRLSQSLSEKEVLLQEVHHRVKNNLQVIASRLALQAMGQRDHPAVATSLRESQNWVKTISLVHEMLYCSNDLASVEFQPFLEQLAGQLGRALAGGGAGEVTVTVAAVDVRLGTGTAVPLGLIVNELLSNAYKHAFANGRAGQVTLELNAEAADNCYCLRVRDNGAGLPASFSLDSTTSLGLRLVRSLARQLEGSITATSRPDGTEFCLLFQEIE